MKTKERETVEAMQEASVEIAKALHRVGAVSDARMWEYEARLEQAGTTDPGVTMEFTPEVLRALREREGASQASMAQHLGVAISTVGQWERGQRRPAGPAAKLLALVQAHGLSYIR